MSKIEDIDEDYGSFEEEPEEDSNLKKILPVIIIIVASLALGVTTYVISDLLINNKKTEEKDEVIGNQIDLKDENVQILYQYVTYGLNGKRIDKFVNNRSVTLDSFSDEEKISYALQFVQVEDFEFTGEVDSEKRKIYTLANNKIYNYMKLFFGPNVKYQSVPSISYPFTFQINKMNVGTMKYNSERDGYDTVFASYKELGRDGSLDPAYGQLISAIKRPDGSIVLQERIVYTELRTDNGGYAVNIYKDPEKTILIDTKTGITDSTLSSISIDVSAYQSTAIVEYVFGVYNMQCYFESSRIIL